MPDGSEEKYITLTFLALYIPSSCYITVSRRGNSGFSGSISDEAHGTLAGIESFVVKNDAGNITYGCRVSPLADAKYGPVSRLMQCVPPYAIRELR